MKQGLLFLDTLGCPTEPALLMTWLVLKVGAEHFFCRVGLVVAVALIAGVTCFLPGWNWWGFPVPYTLVGIADLVMGWFLAGFVIAKVARKSA